MKLFFTLTFKLLVKFAVLSEILNEVIFHLDIQLHSFSKSEILNEIIFGSRNPVFAVIVLVWTFSSTLVG